MQSNIFNEVEEYPIIVSSEQFKLMGVEDIAVLIEKNRDYWVVKDNDGNKCVVKIEKKN